MLLCTIATAFVVIFAPFLASRWAAPSRRVQSFAEASITPEQDDGALRIATYNIAHGRGATDDNWQESGDDKPARITRIAELLKQIDADIVVLNEVDFDSSWSGRQNQAAAIARQAGYPYRVEQRNYDFALAGYNWRFGNAILSKYPISHPELVDLPSFASWESWLAGHKRGVVCEIKPPNSDPVRVMAVHLSHRSEELRTRSAAILLTAAKDGDAPLVIAGDLNSMPSSFADDESSQVTAMDQIIASNQFVTSPNASPNVAQKTFSSDHPRSVIDWILIPRQWHFASYQAIDSTLSDHRPVACEINHVIDLPPSTK